MAASNMETIKTYKISGCDINFPHAAYGTQLSFMGKVIRALETGENALLEAPTGSGKTLSLLCASLGWQQKEKCRLREGVTKFGDIAPNPSDFNTADISMAGKKREEDSKAVPAAKVEEGGFVPGALGFEHQAVKSKPPKIYYATRTHSQISQVVRELKRCGYRPLMAVLAAKQHYCVNSHVCAQPSLEEACEDALKEGQCSYFKGTQALSTSLSWPVHDIEDLSKYGKQRKGCPYYLSRKYHENAEVVFGPYNYFLDPVIRRSMGIELEDSILIFDEAHNIEDVARDAASMELDLDTVTEMIISLSRAVKYNMKPEVYEPLSGLMNGIKSWIQQQSSAIKQNGSWPGDTQEKIFCGQQVISHLSSMGLHSDRIEILWEAYQLAREHDEEMIVSDRDQKKDSKRKSDVLNESTQSENKPARVGGLVLGTLSRMIQIVRMLYFDCLDGGRDYRLVITRSKKGHDSNLRRYRAKANPEIGFKVTLSLWCLNPSIAFKQVSSKSHSVILTSGTLSPLDSFSSELGTKFEVHLEAPHVVNMKKQVFAGVIANSAAGSPIKATYQQTCKTSFQDTIGEILLSACQIIPDGLLVFFSSYSLLDRLVKRWEETGIMQQIIGSKPFVQEPRGGGPEALAETMQKYYDNITNGRGGLFLAVCRGKVSEGLDFSDANARGVIIVGIPFPNIKDSKVDAKRKFNDMGSKSMGLLTGGAWYEQQAFRALNQALGRCIRHKKDWGAILLVDERFQSNFRYQNSLSRWLRSSLNTFGSFGQALISMEDFFAQKKRECQNTPSTVLPPAKLDGKEEVNAFALLMAGYHGSKHNKQGAKSPHEISNDMQQARPKTNDGKHGDDIARIGDINRHEERDFENVPPLTREKTPIKDIAASELAFVRALGSDSDSDF